MAHATCGWIAVEERFDDGFESSREQAGRAELRAQVELNAPTSVSPKSLTASRLI